MKLKLYDIEGLVHVNQLEGLWVFEESLLELRSKSSRYRFKMGDPVLVQVVSAHIETAQIDFALKTHKGKKAPVQKSKEVLRAKERKPRGSRRKKKGFSRKKKFYRNLKKS